MSRQPPPHSQVPAVARLRIRFAKRGRLRFVSHRDFQRAFERALRRAGVPIAFSQGFSPHPKVSYAGAAPTGAASEAEYLEIAVTRRCSPDEVRANLDAALPPGLDVLEVVEAAPGALADRLQASLWELRLPGVPVPRAEAAAHALLAQPVVEVERLTKNGVRILDARSAVLSAGVSHDPSSDDLCAILMVVVRNGTPTVRPDDVLAGLRRVADLVPPQPPQATRLAQGPLDEASGTVGDPLAPDRDTARTRGPAVATTAATDA